MTDPTTSFPLHQKKWPLTHRVAVGAYIFHDHHVLLLKRATPPFAFAPPGGKLEPDEDPIAGLHREVKEETGLDIEIVGPALHWFGSIEDKKPPLLCLNFLAETQNLEVRLSHEHSDFVWASRDDILAGRIPTLSDEGFGYKPATILDSFERYSRWRFP